MANKHYAINTFFTIELIRFRKRMAVLCPGENLIHRWRCCLSGLRNKTVHNTPLDDKDIDLNSLLIRQYIRTCGTVLLKCILNENYNYLGLPVSSTNSVATTPMMEMVDCRKFPACSSDHVSALSKNEITLFYMRREQCVMY